MRKPFIMSLMAANRVGILAALATGLDELGGSFQEIRLSLVGNFFTMILAADFPEERDPNVILDHLRAVCQPFDAEITLRDPAGLGDALTNTSAAPLDQYVMILSGGDRPGILRRVARRLAQKGIDLIELDGGRIDDGSRFEVTLTLAAPQGLDCLKLQQDLLQDESGQDFQVVVRHAALSRSVNRLPGL